MKKIILILIVIVAITSGCEKYTLNKLYGDYTITTYTVNGVDSMSLLYDSLYLGVKIYYEEVNDVKRFDIFGNRKDGKFSMLNCRWMLADNNTVLKFISSSGAWGTGPFGNQITPEWKLLRLTNKEIKMKTNFNNKEYTVELEKI